MKCPPRRFLRVSARRVQRSGRLWIGTLLLAALLFELALPGLAYGLYVIGHADETEATTNAATASAPRRQQVARADATPTVAKSETKTDATARTCCGKCCCSDDQRSKGACCCAGRAKPRPVPVQPKHPRGKSDGGPAITCHCGHSPASVGTAPDMPKHCGRPAAMIAPASILQPVGMARPRLHCADRAPETPPPKPTPLA